MSQPTPLRAAELPGPDTAVWSLGDEVLLRLRSDSVCGPNIEEVHPGLFRVQLLQPETMASLRSVLVEARDWHRQRGQRLSPPNSMHQAGFKVEDVGLDAWVDSFVERVLSDIAQELFPEAMLSPPTGVHGFLVDYGDGADRDLSQHVDDSQVTVNLWLGGDSEGAEVRFEGLRCVRHLDLSPATSAELTDRLLSDLYARRLGSSSPEAPPSINPAEWVHDVRVSDWPRVGSHEQEMRAERDLPQDLPEQQ